MKPAKLNEIRWDLVDLGNDIDALKHQTRRPKPNQLEGLRDQVHEIIMKLLAANEGKDN